MFFLEIKLVFQGRKLKLLAPNLFYLKQMVLALPNNSYLIKMGWTGLPGTNAPGLNDINAFLLEVDPSGKIIN